MLGWIPGLDDEAATAGLSVAGLDMSSELHVEACPSGSRITDWDNSQNGEGGAVDDNGKGVAPSPEVDDISQASPLTCSTAYTPLRIRSGTIGRSLSFEDSDFDSAPRRKDSDSALLRTPKHTERCDDRLLRSTKGRLGGTADSSNATSLPPVPFFPPASEPEPEDPFSPRGRLHGKKCKLVQVIDMDAPKILDAIETEICTWDEDQNLTVCRDASHKLLEHIQSAVISGMLLVHAPTKELERLQWQFSDGGYLQDRFEDEHAYRIFHDGFTPIFREALLRSQSDRWPSDHPHEAARGQPKDGGFAISATGVVRLAAAKFVNIPSPDVTWESMGTRHTTAFNLAHFLKHAVVYVGSDAGTLHVLTAGCARKLEVFRVAPAVSADEVILECVCF